MSISQPPPPSPTCGRRLWVLYPRMECLQVAIGQLLSRCQHDSELTFLIKILEVMLSKLDTQQAVVHCGKLQPAVSFGAHICRGADWPSVWLKSPS